MNFESDPHLRRRHRREKIAHGVLAVAAISCVGILATLIIRLLMDGIPHMSTAFWTSVYSPTALRTGIGTTGILDAIQASVTVLAVTMAVALPVGTAAAIYLHEYAPDNRFTRLLRQTIRNLAGVPSVVYGLLGLAIFVRSMDLGASLLAASLTLAALILPIIIVASEEALKTVPSSIRDASLALGATKWQTIRHHVLPYALPGILTGNILALSRAAGETAPLLVVGIPAYVSQIGFSPMDQGTPLQVRIYFLASDASHAAQDLAMAAVVVLLAATLLLNLGAMIIRQRMSKKIKW